MTSQMMTLLGAFGAMLAFIQAGLPADTSIYIKLVMGAFSAGLSYYLGQTNQGTSPAPKQQVEVTVKEEGRK